MHVLAVKDGAHSIARTTHKNKHSLSLRAGNKPCCSRVAVGQSAQQQRKPAGKAPATPTKPRAPKRAAPATPTPTKGAAKKVKTEWVDWPDRLAASSVSGP